MKQWFSLDRNELLVMLLSYPTVFLSNYLILGPLYFQNRQVFLPTTIGVSGLYVLSVWLMDAWMKFMRYRYPHLSQTARRVTYSMIVYVALTFTLISLVAGIYYVVELPGYQFNAGPFQVALLVGFVSVVLSNGILEAIYFFRQWKSSMAREYELKQLHMQRQLDVLKQQVNPHFLFNSLNSLISLIGENPRQAETFAEELSSVYRYVLQANRGDGPEHNLTDLTSELGFIHSYYQLLKTRHGCGLSLVIAVDERFGSYQIPPLTLQLLVENAVKHNIVMAEQPLTIEITSDEKAQLSVRNTLQKKPTRVLSNGVGLTNIMAKYQMLGQPMPTVQEADGQFVVTLPLIANP
ncbi:sensor histidine kinase [Spirosoma areae]